VDFTGAKGLLYPGANACRRFNLLQYSEDEQMDDAEKLREFHLRAEESLDTMRAAVKKAQAASLARGVPICYMIDGVMHYELPSGEITRECPWPDVAPKTTEG
jgi:hypothetical protein